MNHDPGAEIPALGDTIAVALSKIYGKPMGLVLVALDIETGTIDSTTNIDHDNYVALLNQLAEDHVTDNYEYTDNEGPTKQ